MSPLIRLAHRILIGAAIAFGLFFTVREVLVYRRTDEIGHLIVAIVALVITVALGYYLKNLERFVS